MTGSRRTGSRLPTIGLRVVALGYVALLLLVPVGVVLSTARALGEFGAVSVVSGHIQGKTITLTLLVEQRFQNFDLAGAYAASALLALIALATLLLMTVSRRRTP